MWYTTYIVKSNYINKENEMFTVNFINDEDGGQLNGKFDKLEEATEFCQDTFANGGVDEGDTLQIWSEDDEVTAVAEYVASDFE